jgi:hypothetical protein
MNERDLIQRLSQALQERCKYEGPFSEDGELCGIARNYLAQAPEEPVAWVDVTHSTEGPYEFHGIRLLQKGKHQLYAAPPDAEGYRSEQADMLKTICEQQDEIDALREREEERAGKTAAIPEGWVCVNADLLRWARLVFDGTRRGHWKPELAEAAIFAIDAALSAAPTPLKEGT